MHQEQRQKVQALLKRNKIDRALFAHNDSIKWLTGFAPSMEMGFNYFMGGPFLLWYEGGHFTLIILDAYASDAAALKADADITVLTYLGYTIQQPIASSDHLAGLLHHLISKSQGSSTIGIEVNALTTRLYQTLGEALRPQTEIRPIDNWIVPLRMVKTPEELAKLRRAFALTDVGHAVAQQVTRVGNREIDVWMEVQSAINRKAGHRLPLGNDCVVGYRQQNIGGAPLDYDIRTDSSLIVDLSVVVEGYWSDSCATYYPDEPTAKQIAMHRTAREALDYGMSLLRPGVVAKEVDQKLRDFIAKAGYPVYPHHSGHGVGVAPHEEPRIVPYNDTVLEKGMVIMLEPGIYFGGETSVRLEDAMLITNDGVEVLTSHLPRSAMP